MTATYPRDTWYRELWWAAERMAECLRIGVTCYWPHPKRIQGRGFTLYPWSVWLWSLAAAPFFAFVQAYTPLVCVWPSLPITPTKWADQLHNLVHKRIGTRGVSFYWHEPTSSFSLGYWAIWPPTEICSTWGTSHTTTATVKWG